MVNNFYDDATAEGWEMDGNGWNFMSSTITGNTEDISDLQSVKLENVSEDTTPELGGNLDYNAKGIVISGQTVGGSDGDAVYLSDASTWSQANATDDTESAGLMGIRVNSTTVLTQGIYTTTGLTAGSTYYLDTTDGSITTTAPSSTGNIVRIIGYAISTTELYVTPESTYVEV